MQTEGPSRQFKRAEERRIGKGQKPHIVRDGFPWGTGKYKPGGAQPFKSYTRLGKPVITTCGVRGISPKSFARSALSKASEPRI